MLPGQADLPEGPSTTSWMGAVLRTFAISASEFDAYVTMARYELLHVPSALLHSSSAESAMVYSNNSLR